MTQRHDPYSAAAAMARRDRANHAATVHIREAALAATVAERDAAYALTRIAAEDAMARATANLECDLGIDLGECAMTRERRAAANGSNVIADCLMHGTHAAAERYYEAANDEAGGWLSICRGGPTADCGRTEWHSSHEVGR